MNIARLLVGIGALAAASSVALGQYDAAVRFEGGTARRAEVDPLQLAPFNGALWADLTDWSGTPVTPELIKDKPVLIMTWAAWYPASHSALSLAQAAHTKYADKGLVVVGVHSPRGFEKAAGIAESKKISFPYAHDAKGAFRQALKVDADPDFYLIDRAGNVRYADIESSSVDRAVAAVVKETAEEAAAVPGNVKTLAQQREAERWKSGQIKGVIRPWDQVVADFEDPAAEAYENATWPLIVLGDKRPEWDNLAEKLKIEKPKIGLPEEDWIPAKPETRGKIIAIYLVDPRNMQTLNVLPRMNRTQELFARDVVVVGALLKLGERAFNLSDEDKAKLSERNKNAVESVLRTRSINHPLTAQPLNTESLGDLFLFGESEEQSSCVLVLSSDGVVRWMGDAYSNAFYTDLKKIINVDPGVQARRRAENDAVKSGTP